MKPRVAVDDTEVLAFGLAENYGPFTSEWHSHAKHQVLYAASGTLVLETASERWTLPPERAAFIAAGEKHRVTSRSGIALRTVYLDPSFRRAADKSLVFNASPLARTMLEYATRWGPQPGAGEDCATRDAFFVALSGLLLEWVESRETYSLPIAQTPELARAMNYVLENLSDATVEEAARAAHVSPRTLARRFNEEANMPFRSYVASARMLRAMELLASPRASVSATASEVGFSSIGAFTTAFHERCGETPSAYRARVRSTQLR